DRVAQQDCFSPFALRDVEGHALEEQRPTLGILDQARLAAYPDDTPVAGEKPAFGSERTTSLAASRELLVPHRPIVGMELRVPEERVLEPFPLRESQQRLDMRADVNL